MPKLLKVILYLLLCLPAAEATTTVTANLKSALGTAYSADSFVRFRLRGYSGSVPRVSGGVIVVTIPDVTPDAAGLISTTLYNNYEITPAGTYWTVEYWAGGNMVSTANYTICTITAGACSAGVTTYDLNQATANTVPPVVLAPTGDSTYARLDGGNTPFSGNITTQSILVKGPKPFVDVRAYGAVGNCTTDDTAAIQAAITAGGKGAWILFPPLDFLVAGACYKTTSTLTISNNDVHLFCPMDNTGYGCFIKNVTSGPIITVSGAEFSMEGVTLAGDGSDFGAGATIEGIVINGSSTADGDATLRNNTFFHLSNAIHTKSRNVNVKGNLFTNSLTGLFIDVITGQSGGAQQNRGFVIDEGNRFHTMGNTNGTDAIVRAPAASKAYQIRISGNYGDGSGKGNLFLGAADQIQITDNFIVNTVGEIININTVSDRVDIKNNYFEAYNVTGAIPANGAVRASSTVSVTTRLPHNVTNGNSIRVFGMTDVTFNGAFTVNGSDTYTLFTYPQAVGNATSGGGFYYVNPGLTGNCITAVSVTNATISGNTLTACANNAIALDGAGSSFVDVSGNTVINASNSSGGTYDGISLTSSVSNAKVENNHIINFSAATPTFARYGVNSQATGTHVLAGNSCINCGTAALSASAATYTVSGAISAGSISVTGQLTSTQATGTAPLVISSTTPVSNLSLGGGAGTSVATASLSVTGQITDTQATGTAPLVISSTTPVTNLTTVPTTYAADGTQQVNVHVVADAATLVAGTKLVTFVGAAAFTGAGTYSCTGADATATAAFQIIHTAANQITINGTGTDTIWYVCVGK